MWPRYTYIPMGPAQATRAACTRALGGPLGAPLLRPPHLLREVLVDGGGLQRQALEAVDVVAVLLQGTGAGRAGQGRAGQGSGFHRQGSAVVSTAASMVRHGACNWSIIDRQHMVAVVACKDLPTDVTPMIHSQP